MAAPDRTPENPKGMNPPTPGFPSFVSLKERAAVRVTALCFMVLKRSHPDGHPEAQLGLALQHPLSGRTAAPGPWADVTPGPHW